MENQNSSMKWLAISIIGAAIIISGTIIFSNGKTTGTNTGTAPTPSGTGAPAPTATVADINKVNTSGAIVLGNASAPLVVAEWYDYKCSFCKSFEQDAMAQIITEYVNAGKIRVALKDYAFLSADSEVAALAGRAVWEIAPDKFYAWHKKVFEMQGQWVGKDGILSLTQSVGIDSSRVDQLMTQKASEYKSAINADKAEGTAFGINGTPGSIVGKQLVSGAQPYATVKAAIDSFLAGL